MTNFIINLRTYFKFLSRNKAYTFVSIFGFSIALMFVILLTVQIKQELSIDNFHKNGNRIYLMTHDYDANFANPVAPFVQDHCPDDVESFCRIVSTLLSVSVDNKEKTLDKALFADSTFFSMFSFDLIEGNPTDVLRAPNSVVVTQEYANKKFNGENPIGKTLMLDKTEHTVTGIMKSIPHNSQFPASDFIVSYSSLVYWGQEGILDRSNNFGFTMYFLEKEVGNINAKIPVLLQLFKENFWLYQQGFTNKLEFTPLPKVYFTVNSSDYSTIKTNNHSLIKIYGAIAILILIIATLNYINMTVAQASFRGKEAAIKKLLGSSKNSIVIQLLIESLMITSITFLIGLILAFLAEPYFNEIISTKIQLNTELTFINGLYACIFIFIISFISGIIPASIISNFNPIEIVKGTLSRKVKTSYSKWLIIFQYVVAFVLLISTFFIKQQSDYLVNYNLGYKHSNLFYMSINLDSVQTEGFRNQLQALSGVEKVSLSWGVPMERGNNSSFEKDGIQYNTYLIHADENFFDIYGISLNTKEKTFTDKSLYISKSLFNTALTNKENMTIYLDGQENIISGVFDDLHLGSLYNNYKLLRIYKKPKSMETTNVTVLMNQSANQIALANQIEKEYTKYTNGDIPGLAQFVDDTIQEWYKKEQNLSKILSAFTLLTIIISIMGVLSMSLYMIKQKEKEIGIRKVNGSTEAQVMWLLLKELITRIIIAFVIAVPITWYAMTKWLENFPYRIHLNVWTFALAGIIITLFTLLTVSYMTYKAAVTNPVKSLKSE